MNDRNYVKEYLWLWVKTVIAYNIGFYFLGDGRNQFGGIALVSIIFGLTFFNKVIPFNLFGNHDAVLIFWVLKIGLSILIGFIVFPIVNIYYIVMIVHSIVKMLQKRG